MSAAVANVTRESVTQRVRRMMRDTGKAGGEE